ncbi:tetratricopeptide repeat protein [Burkholderia seminalis]|uniref:Pilus assembly protein n=1 Tax=Burkholderia cenocepacia TaxID=95486 RepID=A0A071M8B9_9BURK|nr:pilus assembly protein [Burkholderia seminalis]AOJ26324.1 pilus assembly protein [Burkholderia seminalis]KVF48573.1 pilus assembly protein [Burkholderia seminalis]MCA8042140.1 pilus assembly protein [Burkholderia seminalis]MCA8304251.1 pilus assembly protein [Burkholderia seminalis]MCA8427974.1 pilus assembly protein [Burkholderia seminalis]
MKRIGGMVTRAGAVAAVLLLGACATKDSGYGVNAQTERAALIQAADRKEAVPDTPGMYLGLIQRMQSQGLYFASLAHIDAYEKTYAPVPESILLRADALRMTDQPAASAASYTQLLKTPLAARGYRGLGLLAGAAGDFERAAQSLTQASELAPTDASMLSDLAYAKLRSGDVVGARVPLMKAAELEQRNPKIVSNLVLYLFAAGRAQDAQRLMNQQHLSADVRKDIVSDAAKIAAAARAQQRAVATPPVVSRRATAAPITPMANNFGYDQTVPLLQRFAQ